MKNVVKKAINEAKKQKELMNKPEKAEEEWIWIEGYKGTDKDMKCRGYQFELGKQFDMPEDAEIKQCESGFHLCRKLKNVFGYYDVENGNRFFKVRALVRKNEEYSIEDAFGRIACSMTGQPYEPKKDVAKSIEFISEVSNGELRTAWESSTIFKTAKHLTAKQFEIVRKIGITEYIAQREKQKDAKRIKKLVSLGYSDGFAKVVVDRGAYNRAVCLASAFDLSMDMKAAYILINEDED